MEKKYKMGQKYYKEAGIHQAVLHWETVNKYLSIKALQSFELFF